MQENDLQKVFQHIWQGGFADIQSASAEMAQAWYQSYIDNYLMADAINDEGIKDVVGFKRLHWSGSLSTIILWQKRLQSQSLLQKNGLAFFRIWMLSICWSLIPTMNCSAW